MPKFFSSGYIIKVLRKKGFDFVSQKGSHVKFRKFSKPILIVIVPVNKREIPLGTFRSIMRQSKLSEEDFEKRRKG